MNLEAILVFVQVAEALSFTTAARALGMPKSTVSKRVMELEEHLGMQLMLRSTRHLTLTEAGQRYYQRCSDALDVLRDAKRELQDGNDSLRGTIRVCAPVLFGQIFLGRVVANYLRSNPNVKVELTLSDSNADPVVEGADITFQTDTSKHRGTLRRRRLYSSSRSLYASPSYLERHGTPTSIAELKKRPLISVVGGPAENTWTLRHGTKHATVSADARFRVNSLFLGIEAVLEGLGICLMPAILAALHVASGRLVQVLDGWEGPRADMFVQFSSGEQLPLRTRRFLEQMERDMPPQFHGRGILSLVPRISLEEI
jgi:DNA-binding transcriptional LysR family regulator